VTKSASIIRATAALLFVVVGLTGCASLERLPAVPQAETKQVTFLGMSNARFIVDDAKPIGLITEFRNAYDRELAYYRSTGRKGPLPPADYLAISGGGDNGAFGAGLLVGWSERGNRPTFKAVTGISTGALSAPFAFLGREYDNALTNVFTNTDADDIFEKRSALAAVTNDGMTDTAPLYRMISSNLDDEMIAKIAQEYDRGRLLMIATTNLDAGRAVIWNIGAIARSGHPLAKESIRRILLASASIPGVFPPVMFDIEIDGRKFEEMHGDGGATAQTFLYPPSVSIRAMASATPPRARTAYIIRNGKIFEDWKETERKTLSVAGRAVSTLISSSGVGDMYRIYGTTKRDGVGFNLALIDADFLEPYKGPFNREYMNALFQYGREKAKAGTAWRKAPPGLAD
jgi:Patatin-like phospholipase